MIVFDRIKEISKKKGYNLKSLARKAGLSENAVYSWKTKTPRTDSLQHVANILDVTIDYLLGKTNDPKEEKTEENMSRDLKEFLEDNEPMFYGQEEFDEEDIEQIKNFMKGYFISKEGKKNRGEDDNGR